jgi:hypothetical protein
MQRKSKSPTVTTVCDREVWLGAMQVLLLHSCYTVVAPLLHVVTCCHTAATRGRCLATPLSTPSYSGSSCT